MFYRKMAAIHSWNEKKTISQRRLEIDITYSNFLKLQKLLSRNSPETSFEILFNFLLKLEVFFKWPVC